MNLTLIKSFLPEAEDKEEKTPPAEDDELANQTPTPEDDETENKDEGTESDKEDKDPKDENVGDVANELEYVKTKKRMYAFGQQRDVTILTKNEIQAGYKLTLQYIINPKTGGWSLRACYAGQSESDMAEVATGEDPTSLIKSLRKKRKITPSAIEEYLNKPADAHLASKEEQAEEE